MTVEWSYNPLMRWVCALAALELAACLYWWPPTQRLPVIQHLEPVQVQQTQPLVERPEVRETHCEHEVTPTAKGYASIDTCWSSVR